MRLSRVLHPKVPLPSMLPGVWSGELHGEGAFFSLCMCLCTFLLINLISKIAFWCSPGDLLWKAESPLATSLRPPLTLATSSKGAWACCGACNVCSRPGPAATAYLPWGVSSASCSTPGEISRPLLLAQGQSSQCTHSSTPR